MFLNSYFYSIDLMCQYPRCIHRDVAVKLYKVYDDLNDITLEECFRDIDRHGMVLFVLKMRIELLHDSRIVYDNFLLQCIHKSQQNTSTCKCNHILWCYSFINTWTCMTISSGLVQMCKIVIVLVSCFLLQISMKMYL